MLINYLFETEGKAKFAGYETDNSVFCRAVEETIQKIRCWKLKRHCYVSKILVRLGQDTLPSSQSF